MKKSLLFSAALLGMVMFSDVTTAEEVIHSGDNEKATTSAIVQTNQNISTKLELKQSENLNTYRSTILDNPYGPSTNQSTGIYKRANDVIEIYVDESTDQTQLPTYTVTTPALTNFSEG
ncbi:hypothetical protein IGJ48_000816 [Enterococcus pernyi]